METSTTRWSRLRARFDEALALGPADRVAYLGRLRTDDPALADELSALLHADGQTFLESALADTIGDVLPILAKAAGRDAAGESSSVGSEVGPYRLLEGIGEGGMGAVYRAERADGAFRQTAALKLVKRGMDTRAVLRRFEAERAILARLDHPAIARLLDGGATEDGRPWFAMEYVDGETITAAVAGLGVGDRLSLFDGVCAAVQHAHARLVVHRDLKPSNILVVAQDERTGESASGLDGSAANGSAANGSSGSGSSGAGARVKLLDFGIAKLLDPTDAEDESVLTVPGVRPMTRAYAAPEQVAGGPVTTATDVWALGVVLYEVLTGVRPFDGASSRELEQQILDGDPVRPSQALRERQPGEGPVLPRQLHGDLDAICLRALRKEPEARYASVEALRDDLRRHREGFPVTASRWTAGYRVNRFVRRHRVGVAMTAFGVVAAIAGGAFYTSRIQSERDRAETEAEKAQQVSDVLLRLFDRDPDTGNAVQSDTLTLRAFLAESESTVVGQLNGQPDVEADVLALLSRLYVRLGRYDRAEPLARRSLALRDSIPDASASARAEAHEALAAALLRQGDYNTAERHYQSAIDLYASEEGDPMEQITALEELSWLYIDRGREDDYKKALALDLEVLALRSQVLGDDHLDVAASHNGVAVAYYNVGRLDDGIRHIRQALEIRRARLGDHPTVANSLNNLAVFVEERGDMAEAVTHYQEAIRIWRAYHGDRHPDLASFYSNLSDTLAKLGRLRAASAMMDSSMVIDRASVPPDHPYIARGLVMRSRLEMKRDRPTDAIVSLEEAVGIYRRRSDLPLYERLVAELELGVALAAAGHRGRGRERILDVQRRAAAERDTALARRADDALVAIRR